MFKQKLDNSGQGSAELILITGGLLVIILFVGNYISNILSTTQTNLKTVISNERDYIINKL